MANSLCFTHLTPIKASLKSGLIPGNSAAPRFIWMNDGTQNSRNAKSQSFEVKATDDKKTTKVNSILCHNCEGEGSVACSQCEGSGVNSKEHFNGRFKVGGLCWLCRGKKSMLCGDCNGAGFLGGFLSTTYEN